MAEILAFLKDRSSWEAPRELLAARFDEIPDLEATPLPSPQSEMRDLGWSFVHDGRAVEAWLAVGGWGLSVDGSSEAGVALAVWYRSIVPADVEVRVSDSMYSFDEPLESGVTVEELGSWYEEHVGELY
ncbi:hypothetical protein [Isoptericola cucumis]|uniref:SUKH-3 immunity protein of toxin-antitoxin system n=1 Tax=Isoptericola cucumis TaxID=1776856 RepID=A0ABQ2BB03_9MICO|nr:hypothetical protein [Isoptericola cucumis]GGI12076.1 hypothetical protein GCM10007368_39370 [Isoptericola cucumis]